MPVWKRPNRAITQKSRHVSLSLPVAPAIITRMTPPAKNRTPAKVSGFIPWSRPALMATYTVPHIRQAVSAYIAAFLLFPINETPLARICGFRKCHYSQRGFSRKVVFYAQDDIFFNHISSARNIERGYMVILETSLERKNYHCQLR